MFDYPTDHDILIENCQIVITGDFDFSRYQFTHLSQISDCKALVCIDNRFAMK